METSAQILQKARQCVVQGRSLSGSPLESFVLIGEAEDTMETLGS
jgi:hypothetical protein